MRAQRILMEWPQERLLKSLKVVISEQGFSPLRQKLMYKKLSRLAKGGQLELSHMDTDWLYRLCAASLMLHDYHWFAWEWRSKWATELATKRWCYPRWDGQKCRLLVAAEQGVGDEIVFASCYNDLAQDVEEAWVECDPRLIPIFTRSFPENLHFVNRYLDEHKRIVPRMADYPKFHEGKPIEAFIMAGNVPKLYRHSAMDFPRAKLRSDDVGFLIPDQAEVQNWCDTAVSLGWPKLGCSWKGRQGEIEPVKNAVSLQYGTKDHEGLFVPSVDLSRDIDQVFDLIASLERVVTTTNAVAHMAGALGVRTDVIKPPPIYATEDDNFNNRVQAWWADDYSDWYPSIKMYRTQKQWKEATRNEH